MDDLIAKVGDDKDILNLSTQYSHHMNVTMFYLCQDMFPHRKYAKTISRNAQYIVAFKNPRDQVALCMLLPQMYPMTWKDPLEQNNACMERPFCYLLLDVHPATPDNRRLLSHLLKHEGCICCYR